MTVYIIATFVVSLATVTACSSSSDEVEDAPPSETPAELEADDGDEQIQGDEHTNDETDTERDELQAPLEYGKTMVNVSNTEVQLECQCRHETLGFETSDDCIVEHGGGIVDVEAYGECMAAGLEEIGEPPVSIHEYFDCFTPIFETCLQGMNDDLEADNCDRVPDGYESSLLDSCMEHHADEFMACESIVLEIESNEEARDWLIKTEDMEVTCPQE